MCVNCHNSLLHPLPNALFLKISQVNPVKRNYKSMFRKTKNDHLKCTSVIRLHACLSPSLSVHSKRKRVWLNTLSGSSHVSYSYQNVYSVLSFTWLRYTWQSIQFHGRHFLIKYDHYSHYMLRERLWSSHEPFGLMGYIVTITRHTWTHTYWFRIYIAVISVFVITKYHLK